MRKTLVSCLCGGQRVVSMWFKGQILRAKDDLSDLPKFTLTVSKVRKSTLTCDLFRHHCQLMSWTLWRVGVTPGERSCGFLHLNPGFSVLDSSFTCCHSFPCLYWRAANMEIIIYFFQCVCKSPLNKKPVCCPICIFLSLLSFDVSEGSLGLCYLFLVGEIQKGSILDRWDTFGICNWNCISPKILLSY